MNFVIRGLGGGGAGGGEGGGRACTGGCWGFGGFGFAKMMSRVSLSSICAGFGLCFFGLVAASLSTVSHSYINGSCQANIGGKINWMPLFFVEFCTFWELKGSNSDIKPTHLISKQV